MGLSGFGCFVVVLASFMCCFQAGLTQEQKDYISWDDFKVDELKMGLASGEGYSNGSRVIVVDKSGKGQSLTVQGAIDMVPEHNTERVKIYILPGIYRFVSLYNYLSFQPILSWMY